MLNHLAISMVHVTDVPRVLLICIRITLMENVSSGRSICHFERDMYPEKDDRKEKDAVFGEHE